MSNTETVATESEKKRQSRAKIERTETGLTITDKSNGKSATFLISAIPANLVQKLAVWGLTEKLRDTYADPSTDVLTEANDMYQELVKGEWSERKAGSGGQSSQFLQDLAEAITKAIPEYKDAPVDAVLGALKANYDPKQRRELASNPQIAVAMNRIALARAQHVAKTQESAPVVFKM